MFLAILGFSGTGKSTLINLIAGLQMPDRGQVLCKGKPNDGPGPERGVVFQSYSLMPWLTVAGNVRQALDSVFPQMPKAEKAPIVDRYIGMVGLSHAASRRPAELSGGMRQRVNVARALTTKPEMLLLDEPLSALDALTRANLQDEIEQIWEADRKTVVLVTNDVDEAILLADRIVPLNPDCTLGEIFEVGLARPRDRAAMTRDAGFKRLRATVTKYLMDVGIAARIEGTRRLPDVVPVHGLPMAVRDADQGARADRHVEFSRIHKIYPTPKGPLTVVEEFDLKLDEGEFVSLIGHSGCGKSIVPTMTAGLSDVSKGVIRLDGRAVVDADPERAVVFRSPTLFPRLSARENVAVGDDKVYPKALRAEPGTSWTTISNAWAWAMRWTARPPPCRTGCASGSASRGPSRCLRRSCCSTSRSGCSTASPAGNSRRC